MSLLREELLQGRKVALAGGVGEAVSRTLTSMGAGVVAVEVRDEALAGVAPEADDLVYDAAPAFGQGGSDGLRLALERAWIAVQALAAEVLIPSPSKGKIVLIAPAADAGPLAEAAGAGLENLARTLSVEWARHAITTTAVAPGPAASGEDVGLMVAYLLSPAGDYFSGCRLELGSIPITRR